MHCHYFSTYPQLLAFLDRPHYISSIIFKLINFLVAKLAKRRVWLPGFCRCCHRWSWFRFDLISAIPTGVNFRERGECRYCRLITRQRLVYSFAHYLTHNHQQLAIHTQEQQSDFFKLLKRQHPSPNLIIGSEYLGAKLPPGKIIKGLRHEDCCHYSFKDRTFDLVLSNDVLEHVADIKRALREIHRILKPGGHFVFTLALDHYRPHTATRAKATSSGKIKHLLPPLYHGNPIDPQGGSLVFYDFGQDFLNLVKQAGFTKVHLVAHTNYLTCHYGRSYCLWAQK